jgi:L-rhamnose mutarotase
VGLSNVLFGAAMTDVEKILGKPEETELLDDMEDCQSTVWHYWEKGFSLFFDENNKQLFGCVEIDNENAVLWGKKIFHLSEKEIIELFKIHNYSIYETEEHEWGERRLSFDSANIDFYFEKNKLTSINYGKSLNDPHILILPN